MPKVASDAVLRSFSERLFALHPGFRPTRALYLDFEGSENNERILSLFWPQRAGDDRFRMLWRGISDDYALDAEGLSGVLAEFDCDPKLLRWVVVFSGGILVPEEQTRFEAQFGSEIFPAAEWVNLHLAIRICPPMARSIREHKNVWFTKNQTMVRKSLEALELEFGLQRPPAMRSRSHSYADGLEGEMGILELEARLVGGRATEQEADLLAKYCEWDVRSMFQIARKCERLLR